MKYINGKYVQETEEELAAMEKARQAQQAAISLSPQQEFFERVSKATTVKEIRDAAQTFIEQTNHEGV